MCGTIFRAVPLVSNLSAPGEAGDHNSEESAVTMYRNRTVIRSRWPCKRLTDRVANTMQTLFLK